MKNINGVLVDEFYRRLEELTTAERIDMQQLMASLGSDRKTWQHWQNGSMPRLVNVALLAQHLHVTCDFLLGQTEYTITEYLPKSAVSYLEICDALQHRCRNILFDYDCSMRSLAGELGVSAMTYRNWIMGRTTPEAKNLIRLCNRFGYSIDYMVGLTDQKMLVDF